MYVFEPSTSFEAKGFYSRKYKLEPLWTYLRQIQYAGYGNGGVEVSRRIARSTSQRAGSRRRSSTKGYDF